MGGFPHRPMRRPAASLRLAPTPRVERLIVKYQASEACMSLLVPEGSRAFTWEQFAGAIRGHSLLARWFGVDLDSGREIFERRLREGDSVVYLDDCVVEILQLDCDAASVHRDYHGGPPMLRTVQLPPITASG